MKLYSALKFKNNFHYLDVYEVAISVPYVQLNIHNSINAYFVSILPNKNFRKRQRTEKFPFTCS